jgi:DNA replication protein
LGYNRDNFVRIKREFESRHFKAKDEAEARMNDLHEKIPELKKIDEAMADIGMRLFNEALKGKDGYEARVNNIKQDQLDALEYREQLLRYNNYPDDYTDVKYECSLCDDTGYIGIDMCVCMKKALIEAGYTSSGIGHLIRKQSFETFNLDYYKQDAATYEKMRDNFNFCKSYAKGFSADKYNNLIFFGATGLGKTHLSTAIAKVVIENGYDVMYDTAQNIFEDFQFERFGRNYQDTSESRTDKYFECDLLIIDDLGTEVANQFTVSCLYNLLNTRINKENSTIINTNLDRNDLRKIYTDRITSRLFGEFSAMLFKGTDIRELKLRMK